MNAKNPFHGRFSLVFFALLAVGSAACGAAPEAGGASDDPSSIAVSTDPPSTETPPQPAEADAGPDAQPSAASDTVPSGGDPSAAGWPSLAGGRRAEPQQQ